VANIFDRFVSGGGPVLRRGSPVERRFSGFQSRSSFASALPGNLEPYSLAEHLELLGGFLRVGASIISFSIPLGPALQRFGSASMHVPRGVEPAALLPRAGEHVASAPPRPRAPPSPTKTRLGSFRPGRLSRRKRARPGTVRLAVPVLHGEQLPWTPSLLADADTRQQATPGRPRRCGPGRGSPP